MYGLIGKKLGHSFSADFFNKKFADENIDERYELLPIPSIKDLPLLLKNNPGLKGLNVTIPYKQEVIPFLTELSEEAKEIGAVNVIKIVNKGDLRELIGYNSDSIGFEQSLKPLLRADISQALILGTGGASKAVEYVLKKLGIKYKFVSRQLREGFLTYDQLDRSVISKNRLIVNTTPLGMFPDTDTCPPLPYQFINNSHLCYDLVYNPAETEFLKRCKNQGAEIKNGLEMLERQALAAWEIWTH